jgi:hypothetical protein
MALAMKERCEKCDDPLEDSGDAYICSYECTYCPDCTSKLENICPNCGGELVRRPKRKV